VAAFEAGSGADQGDEVGCVHGPPAGLGRFLTHAGASGWTSPQLSLTELLSLEEQLAKDVIP